MRHVSIHRYTSTHAAAPPPARGACAGISGGGGRKRGTHRSIWDMNQNRKSGLRARSDEGSPVTACRPALSTRFASIAWCVTRGRRRRGRRGGNGGGGGGGRARAKKRSGRNVGVDQQRASSGSNEGGKQKAPGGGPGTYTILPPSPGRTGGSPACNGNHQPYTHRGGQPPLAPTTGRSCHGRSRERSGGRRRTG